MANDPEHNTADFKKKVELEKEEAVRKAKEDLKVHIQHHFLVIRCFLLLMLTLFTEVLSGYTHHIFSSAFTSYISIRFCERVSLIRTFLPFSNSPVFSDLKALSCND